MDPIEFAARYSFMPNKIKYSDEGDTDRILLDYAKGKADKRLVKQILDQFHSLKLYLGLIAKHNSKDLFDKDVIEAYWLGNKLLDSVPSEEIKKLLLKEFTDKGMEKGVALDLANRVPEGAVPHHSFHVMHIYEATKKTGALTNVDKCRIGWGKVRNVGNDKLIVAYRPLEAKGKVKFGEPKEIEINYDKELVGTLNEGDFVSMHWDFAIQKLSEEQVENMRKYTLKNIRAMNSL